MSTVLSEWLEVLHVLCAVAEYDELPVRHNEDKINTTLSGEVRWPTDARTADDPHTKANLLLQVRLSMVNHSVVSYTVRQSIK